MLRVKTALVVLGAIGLLAVSSKPSTAAPITFSASGSTSCGSVPGGDTDSGSVGASAAWGPVACSGGNGEAGGVASGLGLGVYADISYRCCGTSEGAVGKASYATQFTIDGDPGSVPVGLMLELTAAFTDSDGVAGRSYSVLQVDTTINGQHFQGWVTTDGRSSFSGMTPFTFGADIVFVTSPVLVPTNTAINLSVALTGSVNGVVSTAREKIDAMHTLTFAEGQNVFLIPAGYSVRDIPELNLYGNRFAPPAVSVPEPTSMTLVALGIGAALLRRRRAKD